MKKKIKTAKKKRPATATLRRQQPVGEKRAFPIVGIGASAGGIEACVQLLTRLAPDLNMAYVFILHLSPDYESNLPEIFQRATRMPVSQVKDGVQVEPNHVYVIPPNTFMKLDEAVLKLKSRTRGEVPYHPVDYFFSSLAALRAHNSIGILLSGTATDGTLGLKAIKEAGGITFAQDATAKHDQMPRNAVEAGCVDFVASPASIAGELAFLVSHAYTRAAEEEVSKNEDAIKGALEIIMQRKGVDFFSHYKRNTVYRRIMRRMAIQKIARIDQYTSRLREDDAEVDALFHDFLINVTSFFREPSFYKSMVKTVFPHVLKNLKHGEPFRIWIAGCATGEEAYSTAICLAEFLQRKKISNPVQIFSTDLNGKAIESARLGVYPRSVLQHISPRRLKNFFVKIDGHYQIVKPIREMCIFSQHNLLRDPPFSRMDLISCQNVLIYLEPVPQRKILNAFHYALKPTGFLLIGKSETVGTAADLFQPVEEDARLLTRKKSARPHPLELGFQGLPAQPPAFPPTATVRTESDIEKESDKLLLTRYVPGSVVVNKDLEIIRFRGSTADYMEPASGKASLNLLKMIKDDLLFDLRTAVQEAKKTGQVSVRENVIADRKEGRFGMTIEVVPMKSGKDVYYLVIFRKLFRDLPAGEKGRRAKPGAQTAEVRKLEQALANAGDQIRATSEEFEAAREELQSANEEILSSNEELQSINEELETSKEELQSSNEELTTINDELHNRNAELKQARDYAEGIIDTMRGPLLVLTADMQVRRANKAFYEFFRLRKEDTEGFYIYELADRQWNIPALRDHIREILPGEADFRDFVISHDFPRIGNRTMVIDAHKMVLGDNGRESLILLSFEDITRYRNAEQSLLEIQEQLRLALTGGGVGTWAWLIKTDEVRISAEGERLYGLPPGTSIRKYGDWERCIHPQDRDATRAALKHSIQANVPLDIEFRIRWPDGSTHWILAKTNTYYDELGSPEKMIGVNIGITERRNAIYALEESEKRFHTVSDNAPVMIWMAGADKQMRFLNKTWLTFTGRTLAEESGHGWFEGIHPEDRITFMEAFHTSFDTRQPFKIDYRLKRHDGEYRWIMTHGVPRFTGDEFTGFIGTCIDITDRINLERQKDDFMGIASHELKTPVTSIKAYAQILQEKFRKANDEVSANMLGRLDMQVDKLTGLINTLLDVARIQSGQMEYHESLIDIAEFIRDVTEDMQRTCTDHTIVTQVNTGGYLTGDRERLTQVLNNLISNAVKYSPGGKKIIVRVDRVRDDYVISVQDFGVGISSDVQDKVFGRFFRVSESSGNRFSGLGLGLYIATQIVRQHAGRLWLESSPGKGSTFFFSVPVKNADQGAPETS